jgi:repressor LexA
MVFEGRPGCPAAVGSLGFRVPIARQFKHSQRRVNRQPAKDVNKVTGMRLSVDFRLGFVSIPGRKNVEGGSPDMINTTRTQATTQATTTATSRTVALTKRQRQIYDYVSEFVEAQGYSPSLEEIAAAFGLSSVATVHKHVKHLVDKGYLRKAWNRSRSVEPVPAEETVESVHLPILGTVAAGSPIEAIEPEAGVAELLAVPAELAPGGKDHYVLRVRGDSMIEDQICDGDLVVIEGKNMARNGETVVALVDGAEATLKRFYRNGDQVKLVPANQTMAPLEFHASQIEIRGVVRGLIRHF